MNKTDAGAISIILYAFQFMPMRGMPPWQEKHSKHYLKIYGIEKLESISKNIESYFVKKDIDLEEVMPEMNATTEEKELLLRYIQDNISNNILK